jgi:molybdopterin converting factor subunit 1
MITVRLFAMLREAAGVDRLEVPLPRDHRVQGLVDCLVERQAALGPVFASRRILVAVNQTYASLDTRVADGDEVAFLPPVSGG